MINGYEKNDLTSTDVLFKMKPTELNQRIELLESLYKKIPNSKI